MQFYKFDILMLLYIDCNKNCNFQYYHVIQFFFLFFCLPCLKYFSFYFHYYCFWAMVEIKLNKNKIVIENEIKIVPIETWDGYCIICAPSWLTQRMNNNIVHFFLIFFFIVCLRCTSFTFIVWTNEIKKKK